MINKNSILKVLLLGMLALTAGSCEKDYYYKVPPPAPPHLPGPSATLEAAFVKTPANTLSAAYWKTADYLSVSAQDISNGITYSDGILNMTGTFNGLTSFNKGFAPALKLKAAYDNDNIYILAEWSDTTLNLSKQSWLYNGPSDPLKSDATNLWTSQRNCDHIAFAFDISSATGSNGTFSSVGCQASCHGSGNNKTMSTTSGAVDIWNWDLATSVPMGYLHDMVANSSGLSNDAGQASAIRNSGGTSDRSGPAYEWDGTSQSVTLPNGTSALLDPAFYLLKKAPMAGDAAAGELIYNNDVSGQAGHCFTCHGTNGVGANELAVNGISQNKKSRAALISAMDNVADMTPYWGPLSQTEKDNVVTFLRGLSGVPGYYLTTPSGSCSDLTTLTNITPVNITNALNTVKNVHGRYQVLITRKLKTNNPDDVQFDLIQNKKYTFGVALMDNDGKNHIGSAKEVLTFK